MPKAVITLDEQQVAGLEQVVMDHDEGGRGSSWLR